MNDKDTVPAVFHYGRDCLIYGLLGTGFCCLPLPVVGFSCACPLSGAAVLFVYLFPDSGLSDSEHCAAYIRVLGSANLTVTEALMPRWGS